MKRLTDFFFALLLSTASLSAGTYSGGSGTAGDPYQIANLNDLLELSQTSNDWSEDFIQTANINASETSGWNSGAGFSPLGNSTAKFIGTYDGGAFVIDSLYIDRSADYIGMFGWAISATIKNLGLTNADISGGKYVGALVGVNTTSATVSNCYSTGSVTGTSDYVGGLIGFSNATITDCYSSCSVSGAVYVGGLVGNNSVSVNRSYSDGSVTGNQHVGGLVGYNPATIVNCYSTANVIRSSGSSNTTFGGCVGYTYNGTVESSFSTGSVNYTGAADPTDKGFVGAEAGTTTYSDNFFDSQASNQSSDAVGAATAKTTAEMKDVATFTSTSTTGLSSPWDFVSDPNDDTGNNDYWDMDVSGTINSGYPYLYWEDGDDSSLPVELAGFSAECVHNGVLLSWTTESELENLGFVIEKRQSDAEFWTEIASYRDNPALEGQGATSECHEYRFIDHNVQPGITVVYRLGDVDYSGRLSWHSELEIGIPEGLAHIPRKFGLENPYPNPFNATVTLSCHLTENARATLQVYNLRGQLIETLMSTDKPIGTYHIRWQPANLSSGTYIIRLQSGDSQALRKVMYVK